MVASACVDQTSFGNVHPTSCKAANFSAHSKAQHAKQAETDKPHTVVATIHYNQPMDRKLQVGKHTRIQSEVTEQLTKVGKDEISIYAQFRANKQAFIDMLSQFQLMGDGHHVRIILAKHRIKLVQPDTAPVHWAPYQAGPKMRKIENTEIGKILTEKSIKPTKIEWTAPIVLVPVEDKTLQFCVGYRKLKAVAKRESYTVLRIDECIEFLGKETIS